MKARQAGGSATVLWRQKPSPKRRPCISAHGYLPARSGSGIVVELDCWHGPGRQRDWPGPGALRPLASAIGRCAPSTSPIARQRRNDGGAKAGREIVPVFGRHRRVPAGDPGDVPVSTEGREAGNPMAVAHPVGSAARAWRSRPEPDPGDQLSGIPQLAHGPSPAIHRRGPVSARAWQATSEGRSTSFPQKFFAEFALQDSLRASLYLVRAISGKRSSLPDTQLLVGLGHGAAS